MPPKGYRKKARKITLPDVVPEEYEFVLIGDDDIGSAEMIETEEEAQTTAESRIFDGATSVVIYKAYKRVKGIVEIEKL
jgi:hypothetical protein